MPLNNGVMGPIGWVLNPKKPALNKMVSEAAMAISIFLTPHHQLNLVFALPAHSSHCFHTTISFKGNAEGYLIESPSLVFQPHE